MAETFYLSDGVIVRDLPEFPAYSLAAQLTIPSIPIFAEQATTDLVEYTGRHGIVVTGPAVFIYRSLPSAGEGEFLLEVHVPVATPGPLPSEPTTEDPAQPRPTTVSSFHCAELSFRGPLQLIGEAYPHFIDQVREAGYTPQNESREVYREWHASDSPDNVIDLQIEIARTQ